MGELRCGAAAERDSEQPVSDSPNRRAAEARSGKRGRTDRHAYAIVIEPVLVIIAVVLVVMLILGAVWMLAAGLQKAQRSMNWNWRGVPLPVALLLTVVVIRPKVALEMSAAGRPN